jgi:hypothetical protein
MMVAMFEKIVGETTQILVPDYCICSPERLRSGPVGDAEQTPKLVSVRKACGLQKKSFGELRNASSITPTLDLKVGFSLVSLFDS